MKKWLSFLGLFFFVFSFSQEVVLIKFKDKPSASYYFSNPIEMLSQKALDRRNKYNIPLSETDIPVEDSYLKKVTDLGLTSISTSKWFNGVFAEVTDAQKSAILALDCVQGIESFAKGSASYTPELLIPDSYIQPKNTSNSTTIQLEQIGLNYLHDLNFTGKNITIALMDAGFPKVDTASPFEYIRANNQIKGGYNFVDNNSNFYTRDQHGTMVLSTIGAYIPNQYTGAAMDADFYLFITEKTGTEIPQEEIWWIAAAERADSLGVDIISTSLGYNSFSDSRYSYTTAELNGKTSFISRGAQTASEKGIYVVIAAGNEGNNSWGKLTMPADAVDVFSVGAVNSSGDPASFSSFGPTADGRIKPDVTALGSGTAMIMPSGSIVYSNGTSNSTPIIAGAIACMIQAYPKVHPSVVKQKIRESSNKYTNPTSQMGYGIPNFSTVLNSLKTEEYIEDTSSVISIFPNPVKENLHIKLNSKSAGISEFYFFDYNGKQVFSEKVLLKEGKNEILIKIPSSIKSQGNLLLKLKTPDGHTFNQKIMVLK